MRVFGGALLALALGAACTQVTINNDLPPDASAGRGGAAGGSGESAGGAVSAGTSGATGSAGIGGAVAKGASEDCDPDSEICVTGYYCDPSRTFCRPRGPVGEQCCDQDDCADLYYLCLEGLICDSGVCVMP